MTTDKALLARYPLLRILPPAQLEDWFAAGRLGQVSFPAIARLSGGHYVVLHELGLFGVVVGDTATGIVTWGLLLVQRYTGSLILFDWPAQSGEGL